MNIYIYMVSFVKSMSTVVAESLAETSRVVLRLSVLLCFDKKKCFALYDTLTSWAEPCFYFLLCV
jgi:hypothetical protein